MHSTRDIYNDWTITKMELLQWETYTTTQGAETYNTCINYKYIQILFIIHSVPSICCQSVLQVFFRLIAAIYFTSPGT